MTPEALRARAVGVLAGTLAEMLWLGREGFDADTTLPLGERFCEGDQTPPDYGYRLDGEQCALVLQQRGGTLDVQELWDMAVLVRPKDARWADWVRS